MLDRTVHTIIDKELCNGCGLCIRVCPSETISLQDGKATVTGKESLSCGHCVAVCPKKAIQIDGLDESILAYRTFQPDQSWLKPGGFNVAQLVRLMRSRRSCRNYTKASVDRNLLDDLVKIGITAPSGSNIQGWTFTIFPTRQAVVALANQVGIFYQKINRLAEKGFLRFALKMMGKRELEFYYRNYYARVKESLAEWEQSGRDRLFHGATAAIIVGYQPDASCPSEDALCATQNIILAAHSMGLGSCLIGFAVSALNQSPKLKPPMGIPADEKVYSVIALGWPDEKYIGLAGRKRPVVRYVEK